MVLRYDVMDHLIESCPSFKEKWEEHLNDIWDRTSDSILYTDFSAFARHLSKLVEYGHFDEFDAVFNKIEYLILNGDAFVQEAVVVGLLEDFQNCLLGKNIELKTIEKYLKPQSKKNWHKVIHFWND